MALELICLFRMAEQAEEAIAQLQHEGFTARDLGLISPRPPAHPRPDAEVIESADAGKLWVWGPAAFDLLNPDRTLNAGLKRAGIKKPEEFVQPLLEGALILAISGVGGRVPQIRLLLERGGGANIKMAPEISPLDQPPYRYTYGG